MHREWPPQTGGSFPPRRFSCFGSQLKISFNYGTLLVCWREVGGGKEGGKERGMEGRKKRERKKRKGKGKGKGKEMKQGFSCTENQGPTSTPGSPSTKGSSKPVGSNTYSFCKGANRFVLKYFL